MDPYFDMKVNVGEPDTLATTCLTRNDAVTLKQKNSQEVIVLTSEEHLEERTVQNLFFDLGL